MPITPLTMYRAVCPTTLTTFFTVPGSTTYIVKTINLANTYEYDIYVTLTQVNTTLLQGYRIAPRSTTTIESSVVIETGQTLKGYASVTGLEIQVMGVSVA